MLEPLPSFQTNIIKPESTIIIGLSGGPDSIYLLHHLAHLQKQLQLKLIAAHLDHEWQASSKQAAALCTTTCEQLKIPLVVKKISELDWSNTWNGSIEEVGRNARRYLFSTIAQHYQADAVALAHHAQDQQETFFIRLFRGTSLSGLVGMKLHDHLYIRPLLHCNKHDILAYLHAHAIPYYTDPTNTHDTYLRNRIRNYVIPACIQADSRFEKTLQHSMQQLEKADDFIESYTTQTLQQITTPTGLSLKAFLQLHTTIQHRILLKLCIIHDVTFQPSTKFFKECMKFLVKSRTREHKIHEAWMLYKHKNSFSIKKIEKKL